MRKPEMEKPSPKKLRSLFELGGPTGLIWKRKPDVVGCNQRRIKAFNSRCAGKPAGCLEHRGYWLVGIDGKIFLAHRLVYTISNGRWPKKDIDHINQNKSDNRIENLRVVTRSQNIVNCSKSNSTTGERNIYKSGNKLVVQLWKHGECYHIGSFETLPEALVARNTAKSNLYGEVFCG